MRNICGRGNRVDLQLRCYCGNIALPFSGNQEGGLFGTILNPAGTSTTPQTPSPGKVGSDYLSLVTGFARGEPTLLSTEQQFKPGFIDTALAGVKRGTPDWLSLFGTDTGSALGTQLGANTGARAGQVADIGNLGGAAAAAVRGVNPTGSALADQLAGVSSKELAAGTQLDPASVSRITQGVRGDWAARGLGQSAPAQLDEAVNLATAGQNVLAQREAGAQQAAAVEQGAITNPALSVLETQSNAPALGQSLLAQTAGLTEGAGPTLINPQSNYDIFNTAYNARAAANIAGANNQAALDAY